MSATKAILFYSTFFILYGAINLYIFLGSRRALLPGWGASKGHLLLFLLFSASFILGRILENYWISSVSQVLIWIGSFWFAAMLYLFLGFLLVDVLRGGWAVLGNALPLKAERLARGAVGLATSILIVVGYLNALNPRLKTLKLSLPGANSHTQGMEILVASDIHLGTIVGEKRLARLCKAVEQLKPDLVLLPGDILDEDPRTVMRDSVGDMLRSLRAEHGVYAVTGNHEYIGGVDRACRYLEEHGIRVLRDQAVLIGGLFYLVGREDRSMSRFTGKDRKSLSELLALLDKKIPVILMDHQPLQLDEVAQAGVAFQLSGHTHHGQLWPLNLVTSLIYEVSWGYLKKGDTQFYVSSGYGTWGPPVRIGNHPEMVRIVLSLDEQGQPPP